MRRPAATSNVRQEIRSDRPYPPFDRAMMDGYAVKMVDAGRAVQIAGEMAAGDAEA